LTVAFDNAVQTPNGQGVGTFVGNQVARSIAGAATGAGSVIGT
jgi:hypothetical protein